MRSQEVGVDRDKVYRVQTMVAPAKPFIGPALEPDLSSPLK